MNVYPVGATIPVVINTEKADGTPYTFSGSPALGIRKGIASAVTTGLGALSIDDGGITGSHTIEIDTTAGSGYFEAGETYYLVTTAGTVDSVSMVGKVIFAFQLGPVGADVQAWNGGKVDALNDISVSEVNAEVDAALADYDGPTKAELDSGLSGLSIPTVTEINTKLETEHGAGSWGAQGSYTITPTTPVTNTETGAVIVGATVKIYSNSSRTDVITEEKTDTEGSFTAHVTAPGTYYLRATKEGYQDIEWSEVAS